MRPASLYDTRRSRAKYALVVLLIGLLAILLQGRWVKSNRERVMGGSLLHMMAALRQDRPIRVACAHCGGDGSVAHADGAAEACPVCFGLGFNQTLLAPGEEMVCATCRGMGRIARGPLAAEDCLDCGGRGIRAAPDPYAGLGEDLHLLQVECEHCLQGRYRNPVTRLTGLCPICQGLHFREVRQFHADDALCPACGGMGRVFDTDKGLPRVCQRCEGRGLIRD